MAFNVSSLLMHSNDVPPQAKAALLAAVRLPEDSRGPELERAARSLFYDLNLSCADARELVGLPPGRCG
jgi:hypothetical protein